MCGEETAMLNAMEHQRPVARARPPYVAQQGLFRSADRRQQRGNTGEHTVDHSQRGPANMPRWVFPEAAERRWSRLIPCFQRPGLYEVEFGISLREIVDDCGGGLREGSKMSGLIIGGPFGGRGAADSARHPVWL